MTLPAFLTDQEITSAITTMRVGVETGTLGDEPQPHIPLTTKIILEIDMYFIERELKAPDITAVVDWICRCVGKRPAATVEMGQGRVIQ